MCVRWIIRLRTGNPRGALLLCVVVVQPLGGGGTWKHTQHGAHACARAWFGLLRSDISHEQPCFARNDWHRGDGDRASPRDLCGPLSERSARWNAGVLTAHLVGYHKQSTRSWGTNGTTNSRRWFARGTREACLKHIRDKRQTGPPPPLISSRFQAKQYRFFSFLRIKSMNSGSVFPSQYTSYPAEGADAKGHRRKPSVTLWLPEVLQCNWCHFAHFGTKWSKDFIGRDVLFYPS